MKKTWMVLGLALPLALGMSACNKDEHAGHGDHGHGQAAPAAKAYPITGVVQDFKAEGTVVILKHEKIEGLMDGMTMGFELADPKLGAGLKKGDKVSGTLSVGDGSYILTGLEKR